MRVKKLAQHSENKDHGILPITSWHIDGETVTILFWGSLKSLHMLTAAMKYKKCLVLGRKVTTNLDCILKSRDVTLSTKGSLVKAMVFPVVMYGFESWIIKKAECQRNDAFEPWCWRGLVRVLGLEGDPISPS